MPQMGPIPCFLMELLVIISILILLNLLYFLFKPSVLKSIMGMKSFKTQWKY